MSQATHSDHLVNRPKERRKNSGFALFQSFVIFAVQIQAKNKVTVPSCDRYFVFVAFTKSRLWEQYNTILKKV